MKFSSFVKLLALCLGLAVASLSPLGSFSARAANATWNVNADGSWATGSNWTPTAAPGATSGTTNTDTATFGNIISAARAITVDTGRNILGINFAGNSSAYTLSGGSLILSNNGLIQTSGGGSNHTDTISTGITLAGNATFATNSTTAGRILSIGAVTGSSTQDSVLTLDGSGTSFNHAVTGIIANGSGFTTSITKNGAGNWTLSGANTYTGGTTINAGTLSVGIVLNNQNLGALTSGVTLNGGTLRLTHSAVANGTFGTRTVTIGASGGTLAGQGGATTSQNSRIIFNTANTLLGSGALSIIGNGTLDGFGGGRGAVVITAAQTYSGPISLSSGGLLALETGGSLGSGATVSIGNNAELSIGDVTASNNVTADGGTNSSLSWGNSGLGNLAGTLTLNANLTIANRNWFNTTAQNGAISGVISGAGNLTIFGGTGTVTISNTGNTYNGTTTISQGTMALTGAAASSAFSVSGGGTLIVSSGAGTITRGASLTLNGGPAGTAANFTANGVAGTTTNDTFTGALNIGSGLSNITLTPNATGQATVTFGSLGTRAAGSIALISGNYGATPGVNNTSLIFTAAPSGSNFIGGGGAVTSSTASIIPWLRNTGSNHFLGYDATKGVTAISGEAANLTSGATTNVYTSSGTALTMPADETINSLVGDNASAAVTMAGHTLTVTSGALMASIGLTIGNDANPADYGTLALGSAEGQFSARANRTLTVNSAITGTGGLTLAGDNGSSNIILAGANTYTGVTNMYSAGNVKLTNSLAFQNTTVNYVNGNGATLIFGNGGTTGQTAYTFGGLSGSQNLTLANNNTTAQAVALTIGGDGDSTAYSGVLGDGAGGAAGGSLTKTGTGTLTLTGANTYTGGTTVKNGRLVLGTGGAMSASNTLTLGDSVANTSGIFQLGDSSGAVNTTITNLATAGTGTANAVVGGNAGNSTLTINNGGSVSYGGLIGGAGTNENNLALTKTGAGTLTLTGANTYTGTTTVSAGTLNYFGSAATGQINVGVAGGGNAVMNLQAGSSITMNNPGSGQQNILIGAGTTTATGQGFLYQSGGTLSNGLYTQLQIGAGASGSSYGYYNLSGGTASVNEVDVGAFNGAAAGVLDMSGGTMNVANWLIIGRGGNGSSGVLNMTGGTLNYSGGNAIQWNWGNGGSGNQTSVLNIANASLISNNNKTANIMSSGVSSNLGAVNLLSGGLFQVQGIAPGSATGTSLVNFNGGTLKAVGANTTFLTTNLTGAYVYSGGGTIDNNGVAITLAKGLLAPTGSGANGNPTVTNGGSGYVGAPLVTVTGASGTGATAYATVSGGVVTGIVVTNPGTGYTGALSFTLSGGGGTGAIIGTVTQTANTSGGMTFQGSGTTTLTTASTYTGNTGISMGNTTGLNSAATLNLSYAANQTNIINNTSNSSALILGGSLTSNATKVLGGGQLTLTGVATSTNTQQFNGMTVGTGGDNIVFANNATSNPIAVDVGAISRTVGGTLHITQPTGTVSATNGVQTTTGTASTILTDANGTAYATVGGTAAAAGDWAAKDATNAFIIGGSTLGGFYTTATSAATFSGNADVTTGFTATAGTTVNSIRMNNNTAQTLNINSSGNTTVSTGGILFGSTGNSVITGTGTAVLRAGAGKELVFLNTSTGTPQLNAVIADSASGASSVTYRALQLASGQGQFAIGAANTYTGATYIDGGRVATANSAAFGTGAGANVYIDGNTNGQAYLATGTFANHFYIVGNGWNETSGPFGAIRLQSGTLSGQVTLLGNAMIGAQGGTGTFSGVIDDGGAGYGLTFNGGTSILTNAETYTGVTTISAGTLQLGNGTTDGSIANASNVTNNATLNFNNINPLTYTGNMTGAGVLTKTGAGTLTLGGTNTVKTLNVNANTTIDIGAGSLTVSNGGGNTIQSTTGGTINGTGGGTIILGSNGGGTNYGDIGTASGTTLTINAAITGVAANGFEVYGGTTGGTVVLTNNANTFAGDVNIDGGTLSVSNIGNTGSTTSQLGAGTTIFMNNQFGPSVLKYTGTGETTNRIISLNGTTGGATIDQSGASGNLLFNANFATPGAGSKTLTLQGSTAGTGEISGAIIDNSGTNKTSLTKAGTGTWTLSGANTYTGATTISGGTLQIGNGGTTGSISGTSGVTNNAALVYNRSDPLTVAYSIGGSGSVTQAGSGTLTLSASNSYSGLTTITSGALQVGNGGTSGTLGSGNVVDNASLVFNRSDSVLVNNLISGSGTLTQAGGGVTTLGNSANTYGGATIITSGTLSVYTLANSGVASSIGSGSSVVVYGGGTLQYTGTTGTTNRQLTIGMGNATFDASGVGAITFSNTAGPVAFVGSGARTVTLTGAYVDIVNPNSFGPVLGDGPGGATNLVKSGVGTWVIPTANSYSGGTTLSGGILAVMNDSALGTGAVAFNGSGATLSSIGTHTLSNAISTALGSGAIGGNSNVALNGVISGGNGMVINNTGITTYGASNTYTGNTTISNGATLNAAVAGALATGSSSTITVNNGGTLIDAASNAIGTSTTSAPKMTLAGGTMQLANAVAAEYVGALTLQNTTTSTLDFVSGGSGSVITFASLSGTGTLSILNWNGSTSGGGPDQLIFAQDQSGNLGQFSFAGYGGVAEISLGGGLYEIVPVPEPSTVVGALLLAGFVGYRERRRMRDIFSRMKQKASYASR